MKILVLSDSHHAMGAMRDWVEAVQPDCIIHLGDMYDDSEALMLEYPEPLFYRVPGNCDLYRAPADAKEVVCTTLGGVRFYLTHGHLHHVKSYLGALLRDARLAKAEVVLYGHTHMEDCGQEPDGLWVMNPGSCGYSGTAGLIVLENGRVSSCRILHRGELGEFQ